MKRRAWLAAGLYSMAVATGMAAPAPAEQQRIERLIDAVAARADWRFVRNGSEYAAADAARFLREKFKARPEGVDTAEAFIERIATRSSTSGRPYLVRESDGRQRPAAEALQAELARLDGRR